MLLDSSCSLFTLLQFYLVANLVVDLIKAYYIIISEYYWIHLMDHLNTCSLFTLLPFYLVRDTLTKNCYTLLYINFSSHF